MRVRLESKNERSKKSPYLICWRFEINQLLRRRSFILASNPFQDQFFSPHFQLSLIRRKRGPISRCEAVLTAQEIHYNPQIFPISFLRPFDFACYFNTPISTPWVQWNSSCVGKTNTSQQIVVEFWRVRLQLADGMQSSPSSLNFQRNSTRFPKRGHKFPVQWLSRNSNPRKKFPPSFSR